jgi:hypothetical protein
MSKTAATIANSLWRMSCAPARRRLRQALLRPEEAQARVLQGLLAKHAGTYFGRAHGLRPGMSIAEFQQAVPPRGFDDFRPWIDQMKEGKPEVLCQDPVLAFEKTSGSTTAAKYIPFTGGLRAEFQEAVRAWMGDLFARFPAAAKGPAWWLVSPLRHPREVTAGGIPVGLPGDDEYLGRCERRIASWLWAVPPAVGTVPDLDTSLDWTVRFLLQEPELRLISVWNPSLLLLTWKRFIDRQDRFLAQLSDGTGPDGPPGLKAALRRMPERARELRRHSGLSPSDVWPNLAVISAWADGEAARDAEQTRQLFGGAVLQPKGLLATEGVLTIPWENDSAAGAPALNSHFLEFMESPDGPVRLVHELEEGREYEVLLTTGGGLWRYRLGDKIRTEGRAGNTPRLRWMGRCDDVCDLRGEKLHPRFVAEALAGLCHGFRMLAPCRETEPPHYILFVEQPCAAGFIDTALQSNPHYAHARKLGQLGPIRVFRTRGSSPEESYLRRCVELGQRAGTIKPTALHRADGWERWFDGEFTDMTP